MAQMRAHQYECHLHTQHIVCVLRGKILLKYVGFNPILSSHFELRFEYALCACLQHVVLGECSTPREFSNACSNTQND